MTKGYSFKRMFIFVLNIPASSVCDDDHHRAHKLILEELSPFPKIEMKVQKTLNIGLVMLLLHAMMIIIMHIR